VVQYRKALVSAAENGRRFFSRSLECDSFATAETLLLWRDELRLAGWSGEAAPDASDRLRELAEVERLAGEELSSGLGDRLQTILAELDLRSPQIESVSVLDAPAHLPDVLRRVLEKLGATFDASPTPTGAEGSDLWRVQKALATGASEKLTLAGDGTLVALTAYSEITLAHGVAQLVADTRASATKTTLLATGDARPLETALGALDEPLVLLGARSQHRPILALLSLALRLRWQPLDPGHLLEFLVHPVSPMRGRLRRSLARVVAEYPGLGSAAWLTAIAESHARIEADHKDDAALRTAELARMANDLAEWIDVTRFDTSGGAPGAALAETCDRVGRWASARTGTAGSQAERAQFMVAASQAVELGEVLRELPNVTQAVVDRLFEQIGVDGTLCGDTTAELSHVHHAVSPAAVLETPAVLVWWGFHGSAQASTSPWTRAERSALAARGVALVEPAAALEAASLAALRPVLAARERLILVIPRQRANEPLSHHPLHDRLDALIKGGLRIVDLDAEIVRASEWPRAAAIPRRPLSPLRRWWKLADGSRLAARDAESFSGARLLIYDPFAWVLQYKAGLRPGALAAIDEARQRGNLLHRVTEHLFGDHAGIDWRRATEAEFHAWLNAFWPELLEAEGANFCIRGRQADGERLLEEARRAVWRLIVHLREADVARAVVKVRPADARFGTGVFGGEIDLEIETRRGSRAVIDLKYGQEKIKRAELADNIQLQLATYGFLRNAEGGGSWPEGAYFIFRKGVLLAQNRNLFPNATIVPPKGASLGLEACWRDFERIWQWRREQLDGGWIELPLEGTDPTDGTGQEPASPPPDPRWIKDAKAKRFDDFTALTGWRNDQ
jgi:hypothetical protein